MIKRIWKRLSRIAARIRRPTGIAYWKKRVEKYGKRAVFNLQHPENELESVTLNQKKTLIELLKTLLSGKEKIILDFGCGTGRFTPDLAELIKGKAIGIDPVKELLAMTQVSKNVAYKEMKVGNIPLENSSVDIIWICLVLGGIVKEKKLKKTLNELNRVLKPGGLVFLVENTTNQENQHYWKYRSIDSYIELFSFAEMTHYTNMSDLQEQLSIIAGRKYV